MHTTPAGIKQIIDAAVKVCPALANLAIERTWAGLRPVTPDTFPVLGASPRCPNLFVAGGYWRNGVLLAPKTAQLVADALCGTLSPQDEVFSKAFSMDRFTVSGAETPATSRPLEHQVPSPPVQEPLPSSGGGALSWVTPAENLEFERAAAEGLNDSLVLSDMQGFPSKEFVVEDEVSAQTQWDQYSIVLPLMSKVTIPNSTPTERVAPLFLFTLYRCRITAVLSLGNRVTVLWNTTPSLLLARM